MFHSEFFRSLILIGALFIVGASAEVMIPDPRDRALSVRESSSGEQVLPDNTGYRSREPQLPVSRSLPHLPEGGGEEIPEDPAVMYLEEVHTPITVPLRNWDVPEPVIQAKAAFVLELERGDVLFARDEHMALPIASLTKLMTALVVRDYLRNDEIVSVSKEAVLTEGAAGSLHVGEELSVEKLLYFLLLPSSNDAASALAERLGTAEFVAAMNRKAAALSLRATKFLDPSGLSKNYASAQDLAAISREVWNDPFLRSIAGTAIIDLVSEDGVFQHHLVSSNKLLGAVEGVVGGKTGYTAEAGQTMVLFIEVPEYRKVYTQGPVRIVSVLLNSPDRNAESAELAQWVLDAYTW